MLTKSKFNSKALKALSVLTRTSDRKEISTYLYTPHRRLARELKSLDKVVRSGVGGRAAGEAMERVAYVLFSGLAGYSHRVSYQSSGPQIDLLVRGNTAEWYDLCDHLHLAREKRGVLVEAKATKAAVDDPVFARLCGVIHHNMSAHVGLGVFVTLAGATGFKDSTQRKMSDVRLRQALFHAHTQVPIVVLDRQDLGQMTKPGALVELLEARIVEIEQQTGALPRLGKYDPCKLPKHLQGLDK